MNAAVAKLADAANRGGRVAGASREPLKVLGEHPRTGLEIKLMDGRYGAYVTDGTTNATIPKTIEKDALTLEEAAQLIDERAAKGPTKGKKKRSEEHTAELQSLMRNSYDVFSLKKNKKNQTSQIE